VEQQPEAGSPPARVVIIGGGFSGAMTAANIARFGTHPMHVTVVDQGGPVGRGVAYGLRRPEYLLNVAARNMSAFPDEPDHFVQWLRTRSDFASVPDAELRMRYVPRQIYGDYVCEIVLHHLSCPGGMTPVVSDVMIGEAVDVEPAGPSCHVHLADGSKLEADRVVLATGNEAPALLPGAESLAGHRSWAPNPWHSWEQRLPAEDAGIVILGTGLSTVDVILTLHAVGWTGRIDAVSRHGWFPHPHFRGIDYPEFPPPGVDLASLGLDALRSLVEQHCCALAERDANPAMIVDKLRSQTQRIWRGFTVEERLDFIHEDAARWNVHRHRIAPEIHAVVADAQRSGQLHVHAAGIEKLEASGDAIAVHLADGETLTGGLVINATGPATRFSATRSVLLQNLLRRGLVTPDTLEMGVRVDPDHTIVTADGERSPWLLALGPLLKGTYWETIAVPELRMQARRLADTLLHRAPIDEDLSTPVEYTI
jgi:uncharacterized NAD(P)/FAD-binding protein YdhS